MKTKVLLIGAILLLALSVAYAADVTGKWAAEMQGRNGPTTTTFTFKADGAKLTGTMQGAQGDPVEIQEGKMEGDNISFVTVRKMGEMEMKSEWKGTVAGDEMKLTRTMVPPPGGFGPPQALLVELRQAAQVQVPVAVDAEWAARRKSLQKE
jgi:hypothetical protein